MAFDPTRLNGCIRPLFKSLEAFAVASDFTGTTISNWLSSKTTPKITDLQKAAKAAKTTVAYLIGEIDDSDINALKNFKVNKESPKEQAELLTIIENEEAKFRNLSEEDFIEMRNELRIQRSLSLVEKELKRRNSL